MIVRSLLARVDRHFGEAAGDGTTRGCNHVGTVSPPKPLSVGAANEEAIVMRSILLWLIGIPIPIILLIAFCTHHF